MLSNTHKLTRGPINKKVSEMATKVWILTLFSWDKPLDIRVYSSEELAKKAVNQFLESSPNWQWGIVDRVLDQ